MFFDGLFRSKNKNKKNTPSSARRGYRQETFVDGVPMAVATVFRCVKLLGDSIANLPVNFLRYKNGVFVDNNDDRLWYLLNISPDGVINAFDFWRQVGIELLMEGNAYIYPDYSGATPEVSRLVLCTRGTVVYDDKQGTYTINDISNGLTKVCTGEEIIHIKGMTMGNARQGVSVLTYARLNVAIATMGDKETYKRFSNGGNVKGLVTNDTSVQGFGAYADDELAKTAQSIDGRLSSGENIVNIPGAAQFHQLTMTSADMEFLASRKFSVEEICRFFGVHPTFVFADTSNNYKSVEQANVAFLSLTLNPLLRNIETELRRKLIAPSIARKYKFMFDRRGLYASDLDGLMRYRQGLLQTGTTVNEVRKMNDLPEIEGGDKVFISTNLRPLDETIQNNNNQE